MSKGVDTSNNVECSQAKVAIYLVKSRRSIFLPDILDHGDSHIGVDAYSEEGDMVVSVFDFVVVDFLTSFWIMPLCIREKGSSHNYLPCIRAHEGM